MILNIAKKKFIVTQNDRNLALLGNGHEIKRVLNTIPDMPYKDNVFFRRILAGMSQEDIKLKSQTMFSAEEASKFYGKISGRKQKDYGGIFWGK